MKCFRCPYGEKFQLKAENVDAILALSSPLVCLPHFLPFVSFLCTVGDTVLRSECVILESDRHGFPAPV